MASDYLQQLGIAHPIILAPMAGGAGTPELVAAVSNAGGLGSFGGAYSTPQQILDAARQIRALTRSRSASICLPAATNRAWSIRRRCSI